MPSQWLAAAQAAGRALLDLVYPEVCLFCDAELGEVPWSARGEPDRDVSWFDGPHLCRDCLPQIAPQLVQSSLPISGVPVLAGRATGPELVAAIAHWKYHGVRGLAWPLSSLLRPAVTQAVAQFGNVDCLVPIPLHRNRRRARGFNQAEVLARLGATSELTVETGLLVRQRATGQQAKLGSDEERRANLAGAFAARNPLRPEEGRKIGLVDDLVTGGMTCEAAVAALVAGGWQVAWVVCLGLAVPKKGAIRGQVDRRAAEI